MIHPAIALILGALALLTAILLFWPSSGQRGRAAPWGWGWRFLRLLQVDERVRIEDALKHLHDSEYRRSPAGLHSLAGALGVSGDRAAALLERLAELGLVDGRDGAYKLTAQGRREALQVIRVHRLWERYLSEETGYPPTEWHAQADALEHTLAPEEVDALARRMGEPRYDPHGDPIPTREGEIAPPRGRPLAEVDAGTIAEIVHVEDEPEAIYAQLVAEGLAPGTRLRVIETTPRAIRFESGDEEHVLAPVLAANLTVRRLTDERLEPGTATSLADLEPAQRARVSGFAAGCRGAARRRLLDLGLVPGTVVVAELRGAGRGPVAFRVRGALIALRHEQASLIRAELLSEQERPDEESTTGVEEKAA